MKKFLKENIVDILLYLLIFACGLAIPISILVGCLIEGEIFAGIVWSMIFGSPILTLLGFIIWMFVQDYKREVLEDNICLKD